MSDMRRKSTPWTVDEVHTFLCLVAEEKIQRELDGATRNERVFREVAQLLAAHGYHRTYQQCREKLKKLKSDYRSIKEHRDRSGCNRKNWKWFDQMDAIYGRRPASQGRAGGLDSATYLEVIVGDAEEGSSTPLSDDSSCYSSAPSATEQPSALEDSEPAAPASTTHTQRALSGQRKRRLFKEELRDIHSEDVEQQECNRAQRERHIQLLLNEAREAREMDARLRREENAQTAAFNQAFLCVLGQLVQAMSDRCTGPAAPPLD